MIQKLQKTALFGVIEGGFSIQERQKSAHETVTRNVDGELVLIYLQLLL